MTPVEIAPVIGGIPLIAAPAQEAHHTVVVAH